MTKNEILKMNISTDNVPTFSVANIILEEKLSLLLLANHYSGNSGKYMESQSDIYQCDLLAKNKNRYNRFEITKFQYVINLLYGYTYEKWTDFSEFKGFSLYSLFQTEAAYKGIYATCSYFGMKTKLPFEEFKLNSQRFCNKPFPNGKDYVPHNENISYETGLQNNLSYWYYARFIHNVNRDVPREPDSLRSSWMTMIFDFKDECEQTVMKVVKLYFMLKNHTFGKCYIPLTRWYSKDINCNFTIAVGLPGKQILMNLPEIACAEKVVICLTLEDAFAMQRMAPADDKTAYTAFVCDGEHYEQVDFSPIKNKEEIKIMISNNGGNSLAESYLKTVSLYKYLCDEEKIADIGFIQRQVIYPSLEGVFDIDALMRAHRNQKPVVAEGSIIELSENQFPMMLEEAQAEIMRKKEQSQDRPFWNKSLEETKVPTPLVRSSLTDGMILRPYLVEGTTTIIESTPGMGKSCICTALAAYLAGSKDPFFDQRCMTRCTPVDANGNKVVYLVFDADGQLAIDEHRKDFARNIGENDANFIQRNMAGNGIDYSLPANYNALCKLLDEIRDNEGTPGQQIRVLFIDTLLAFSHNKPENAFEVFTKLNKDYPHMGIFTTHHLNLNEKTFGGIRTTMGPRVIITLFRSIEQIVEGRQPTLCDPFTVKISKFNMNKIPEDGKQFTAKLDEKGHFVVLDKEPSRDTMRRLLVNEYITKFKLTQAEIAKLFGTTDRTIRNWLADEKNH